MSFLETTGKVEYPKPELNEIWKIYSHNIFKFILERTKDIDTAEDLFHDVYIKAEQGLKHLKNPDAVKSWLLIIARNQIADLYRKKLLIDENEFRFLYNDNSLIPNKNERVGNFLMYSIHQLPLKFRGPIFMSEVKGMKQVDIAKKFKLSYACTKSRIQRGRILLRKLLDRCCQVEFDNYGNVLLIKHKPSKA